MNYCRFEALRSKLEEMGHLEILEDPTRIFNCDESNLQLCPKTGNVYLYLRRRGAGYFFNHMTQL